MQVGAISHNQIYKDVNRLMKKSLNDKSTKWTLPFHEKSLCFFPIKLFNEFQRSCLLRNMQKDKRKLRIFASICVGF